MLEHASVLTCCPMSHLPARAHPKNMNDLEEEHETQCVTAVCRSLLKSGKREDMTRFRHDGSKRIEKEHVERDRESRLRDRALSSGQQAR